ncbi:PucR family transcriptional regulator ligand-binding domain-containing protein [Solwaraspora sp. WMMD1047]|uniref:PucR family transcriptional regulator n=1 Tax=Solwaraspora sp. WMMD1047 TaxID=3016102 RepID=UPI00241810E2|nr:PucR family transcriptional regulator [Solwaraspora sp. WMMD1047]MDG4830173.1 PucR family transcriptional regulator ligand-binding domain-containing protein [Solwaraspora sp. WMMD1047]
MLLREALDLPALRLTVLAGADDLDRPVSRVYVTDLPDPRRYLTGGEIVLTGLMWRRRPADSELFAAACAAAGVAAIGAGDAAYGSVPDDLVAACRRHRIPLFEVPVEVSFREILDGVNPTLWARRASGLATVLGRHRGLVAAMAGGARLADLLPPVAADLGVDCWVLTPTGRLVAATAPLPATTGAAAATAYLTAVRLPTPVVLDGRPMVLAAVPGRPEHRLSGWLLAVAAAGGPLGPNRNGTAAAAGPLGPNHTGTADGGHPGTDRAGMAVAGEPSAPDLAGVAAELVSPVALERAQFDEAGRIERRLADQVGAVLAGRGAGADLPGRLLSCGLPPDATFLAVAARLTGLRTPPELAVAVCEEVVRTAGAGQPAVVTGAGPPDGVLGVLVVAPPQVATVVAGIRAAATGLAAGLTGTSRLAIGVSDPADGAGALAGAVEEARHALGAATAGTETAGTETDGTATAGTAVGGVGPAGGTAGPGGAPERVRVVAASELASHLMLLAGLPVDARRSFRDRLLGPLLAYDRAHDAELVRTLDSFLASSGSWSRCAALLHVHVNTLRYRIGRIEQLTGRDLTRFEDRVDFFLALRLPAETTG